MGLPARVASGGRGCSDARRRPMGLPGGRLRRGLGLPSCLRAGALKKQMMLVLYWTLAGLIFEDLLRRDCGILWPSKPKELRRHPLLTSGGLQTVAVQYH